MKWIVTYLWFKISYEPTIYLKKRGRNWRSTWQCNSWKQFSIFERVVVIDSAWEGTTWQLLKHQAKRNLLSPDAIKKNMLSHDWPSSHSHLWLQILYKLAWDILAVVHFYYVNGCSHFREHIITVLAYCSHHLHFDTQLNNESPSKTG